MEIDLVQLAFLANYPTLHVEMQQSAHVLLAILLFLLFWGIEKYNKINKIIKLKFNAKW